MTRVKAYPLKFKPIYKRRIWGGQKLRQVFNKDIPAFEKIGESWEMADLPEDKSVICNSEFAGQTLDAIVKKYPEAITGNANFTIPFPLLIKFLDAEDILIVQVHPDPADVPAFWVRVSRKPNAVNQSKGILSATVKSGSNCYEKMQYKYTSL